MWNMNVSDFPFVYEFITTLKAFLNWPLKLRKELLLVRTSYSNLPPFCWRVAWTNQNSPHRISEEKRSAHMWSQHYVADQSPTPRRAQCLNVWIKYCSALPVAESVACHMRQEKVDFIFAITNRKSSSSWAIWRLKSKIEIQKYL